MMAPKAQAETLRMSSRARDLTNRAETEMGRLESAAITALESSAASHREEVAVLRAQLHAAEESARDLETELAGERALTERLRSFLADRDQQLATLRTDARAR
jgi:chromosome segregation ATPase